MEMNMYTEKNSQPEQEQKLILSDRKHLSISGVNDVLRFDETTASFQTSLGKLTIKGENLRMETMDVESGNVILKGKISALAYMGDSPEKSGFFNKITR